jgi:transposase
MGSVVNSRSHRATSRPRDGKRIVSGPPLLLRTPEMDGPSYKELEPDDALYALGAFAYHHAGHLPRDARRGLLLALAAAWPTTQGDHKDRDHRSLMAWHLHRDTGSIEAVANAFAVAVDTAARWVRRVDRELDAGRPEACAVPGAGTPNRGEEWRVDVVWTECGEEPEDPAGIASYMRMLAATTRQAEQRLDDRQRAINAGAKLPGPMAIVQRGSRDDCTT